MNRLTKRLRDESGSALALALLVLLVLGLVVSAAVSFANNGLLVTPQLRDQRNLTNYAEGSVDAAINRIRGSATIGSTTGPACPTYTAAAPSTLAAPDSSVFNGHSFTVACSALSSPNNIGTDEPPFAILALGSSGITENDNGALTVDGDVFSHGPISITNPNGQLNDFGSVYGTTTCDLAKITSTDATGVHCPNYVDTNNIGADPAYPPAVDGSGYTVSQLITDTGADQYPTCSGGAATFQPGYYSQTPNTLLAAAHAVNNGCTGNESFWWFQPGRYYFDFPNSDSTWNTGAASVVGGTLTGTLSSYVSSVPWGTACDPTQPGVQFEFGGVSQVSIPQHTGIELCGPTTGSGGQGYIGAPQSIALYGLSSNANNNTGTPTLVSPQPTYAATSAPTSSDAWLPSASNAQNIDTTNLATSPALTKNQSASLSYSHFAHLPDGYRVTTQAGVMQLFVEVAHVATYTTDPGTTQIVVKTAQNPTGTTYNVPASCPSANPCDVPITVPAPAWREANSISLTYTVTAGNHNNDTATDVVDGIRLTAAITPPTLENLNPSAADFISATAPDVHVHVHGTVYTPTASLDIETQNNGTALFSRGVVVSSLTVNSIPSFKQVAAPFQLGPKSIFRLVQFTGSIDGKPTVVACVLYNDQVVAGNPTFPGYSLKMESWTVLRTSSDQAPTCTAS